MFPRPFLILLIMLAFVMPADAARPRSEILPGPLHGSLLDVLDGDTLSVRLHVWIGQVVVTDVRISGIDTPELRGKCERERNMAVAARNEVRQLLESGGVVLSDIKLEKYAGRVLAQVTTSEGIQIGDYLIAKRLARPYQGKTRLGWCA